jgi:hypothetical protein
MAIDSVGDISFRARDDFCTLNQCRTDLRLTRTERGGDGLESMKFVPSGGRMDRTAGNASGTTYAQTGDTG